MMKWPVILAFLALGAVWRETCAQSEDGPAKDVRLVTFNTGMTPLGAGLLASYAARRSALLEATRTDPVFTSADVVCLQELQAQDDLLDVRTSLSAAGLGNHYAFYDHFYNNFNNDQPACNLADAAAAFQCSSVPCQQTIASGNVGLIFICLIVHCPTQFRRLAQTCIPCVGDWRAPGFGNINAAVQRCGTTGLQRHYIQQHGLLLSSRVPLTNVRYRQYANGTTMLVRGYIQATVCVLLPDRSLIVCGL